MSCSASSLGRSGLAIRCSFSRFSLLLHSSITYKSNLPSYSQPWDSSPRNQSLRNLKQPRTLPLPALRLSRTARLSSRDKATAAAEDTDNNHSTNREEDTRVQGDSSSTLLPPLRHLLSSSLSELQAARGGERILWPLCRSTIPFSWVRSDLPPLSYPSYSSRFDRADLRSLLRRFLISVVDDSGSMEMVWAEELTPALAAVIGEAAKYDVSLGSRFKEAEFGGRFDEIGGRSGSARSSWGRTSKSEVSPRLSTTRAYLKTAPGAPAVLRRSR